MEYEKIYKRLANQGVVYILDDFEEVAIRLVLEKDKTIAYLKRKGRKEGLSDATLKTVFDVELEGVEITKEEYDNY